jgi:hypothetical protein
LVSSSGWTKTSPKLFLAVPLSAVPNSSVVDSGCLSRIPDPDLFHPESKTFDPRSNKKRGGHKFQEIENYLIFEQVQKKI